MRIEHSAEIYFCSISKLTDKGSPWNTGRRNGPWTILIHPDAGSENGYSVKFTVFNDSAREDYVFLQEELLFSFFEKPNDKKIHSQSPADKIEEILRNLHSDFATPHDFPNFFTMLPSMRAYRLLVSVLGVSNTSTVLRTLHDLVATKATNRSLPTWYKEAIESTSFNIYFLRNSESFFTFYNAQSILLGLQSEELDRISSELHLKFKLRSFENEHNIHLNFDIKNPLKNRISVIIGKNGVGKSQALYHLAQSLLNNSPALRDEAGERPKVNRLIAVSSPGETKYRFPPRRRLSRITYQKINLGRNRANGEQGLGNLLVRLSRSEENIKGISRWEIFLSAIKAVENFDRIHIFRKKTRDLSTRTRETFPLSAMLSGSDEDRMARWHSVCPKSDVCSMIEGKAVSLSSGQITFIRFAAHACFNIENGTIFLFDEPETHLHPNLINDFISLLSKLLDLTGSIAIIATHSPYFVRETSRSQVVILTKTEDCTIKAITPRLKTLGADIGEISHFIFGDQLFGRLHERFRSVAKEENIPESELLNAMENELAAEAWMSLNRILEPQ